MGLRNTFSTVLTDFTRNGLAYAETTNAFPAPSGGIITLADKTEYIVSQLINFGTNKLKVPDNGQVVIRAANRLTNNIQTELTGLTPFIIGDVNRLLIEDIVIDSVNDAMFLDVETVTVPFGIVTLQRSRIQNFGSLGKITTAALQTIAMGLLNNDDGFTLTDNTIISMEGTNFADQGGDHITLKGDIGTARFFNIAAAPSTGDAFFNLDYDTITDLTVTQCPFDSSNGGSYLKAEGKDQTEIETRFIGNVGAQDSYWIGSMGFSNNATPTVVGAGNQNVYLDVAGTMTGSSIDERFIIEDNVMTYIGREDIKVLIPVDVSVKRTSPATSSRTIRVAVFVDEGSGFSEVGSAPMDMSGILRAYSFHVPTLLKTGYKIKPQIKNIDTEDNILPTDIRLSVPNL